MPTERMGTCAGCGGVLWVALVDVSSLSQPGYSYVDGRVAECETCGGHLEARWAVHTTPEAYPISEYGRTVRVLVWAGPPAPYPHVPSHAEWLKAWGVPAL